MRTIARLCSSTALLAAATVALAPAATARPQSAQAQTAARTVIVSFASQTSAAQTDRALATAGLTRVHTIGAIGAIVARATSPAVADKALTSLNAQSNVRYAEQDGLARIASTPTDPSYAGSAWAYTITHLDAAWDIAPGANGATVALLDTGVDPNQPDLAGTLLTGYNAFDGSTQTADDNGHGTETASILAAHTNNGIGAVGVCGGCRIFPVKVMDAGGGSSWAVIADGIVHAADSGARVISMSIAGMAGSDALQAAIVYAQSKGIVVVAAAGNDGAGNPDVCYGFSSSCGGYPAAYPGVLSVAASDESDQLYRWSNFGWVQVAAPGCLMAGSSGGAPDSLFCGTSAAAPFVAGIAALALSADPTLTGAAVRAAIENSAAQTGAATVHGRVDALATFKALGIGATPVSAALAQLAAPRVVVSSVGHLHALLPAAVKNLSGLRYQWQRLAARGGTWQPIRGATGSTLAVGPSLAGRTLRVRISVGPRSAISGSIELVSATH